jgi:3-oxoacyl-[acyl-carrier protein] reductase
VNVTVDAARTLTGRVAVVTGAGSGIGRAIARRCAREGATVFVADIDAAGAGATVDEIGRAGGTANAVECDVAEPAGVAALFDVVDERAGRVDVLVNNAGIAYAPPAPGEVPFPDDLPIAITDGQWHRMIGVHLYGTFACTRAAVHRMVRAGTTGSIVNISSVSGMQGGGSLHYSAAKTGILGFTRAVAHQVGPHGIRVNAVCPGLIDTPLTRAGTSARTDAVIARTPLRRMGEPDDIASAVLWLASDESSFVTGQWLSPNGGLMMI